MPGHLSGLRVWLPAQPALSVSCTVNGTTRERQSTTKSRESFHDRCWTLNRRGAQAQYCWDTRDYPDFFLVTIVFRVKQTWNVTLFSNMLNE